MVYTQTTGQSSGSGRLVEYIEQEKTQQQELNRAELRDLTGRELTDDEITEFVENSERDNFSRQIILSAAPDNQLSEKEMRRKTENVLNNYIDGKPSAHYLYGVHEDTDQIHSHAAVRGDRRDLYLDTDELKGLKVEAEHEFQGPEQARELANTLGMELSKEHEQRLGLTEQDQSHSLGVDAEHDVISTDDDLDLNLDLGVGREQDQDLGRGMGR